MRPQLVRRLCTTGSRATKRQTGSSKARLRGVALPTQSPVHTRVPEVKNRETEEGRSDKEEGEGDKETKTSNKGEEKEEVAKDVKKAKKTKEMAIHIRVDPDHPLRLHRHPSSPPPGGLSSP